MAACAIVQSEWFFRMLSSDVTIDKLSVLPCLYNSRIDILRLVQQVGNPRWVLRLWPADVKMTGKGDPLFVGTVVIQDRRHIADLIWIGEDTEKYDSPLQRLEQMLSDQFNVKSVNRSNNEIQLESQDRHVDWHGRVLLIW